MGSSSGGGGGGGVHGGERSAASEAAADEWRVLHEAIVERLRHEVTSCALDVAACKKDVEASTRAATAQVGALKGLVERQMRSQTEVEDALRAHTRTITKEICEMMKQYVHLKMRDFADGCDKRFVLASNGNARVTGAAA